MRFSYLCLDIFARRFFLIEPTAFLLVSLGRLIDWRTPLGALEDDFVQRDLDDPLGTGRAQRRDEVADGVLLDD